MAQNDLQAVILSAAGEAVGDDHASLEQASVTIRALFAGGMIPEEVAAAIAQGYAHLGAGEPAVAVRSSAPAEDLPGLSFAGQQETYLNVSGEAAVIEAVKSCWASLWTARAIGYRLRMGVEPQGIAMAVVVQAMVPAEAAGVLFTANPTTGRRDEVVVNASFGLGEAVVGGQVTPDSYLLDKASLGVREVVLGSKEVEVVSDGAQGTASRPVSSERRGQPALAGEQLRQLGKLALEVEQVFGGAPQDVEWALAEGRVWLLQARPMTGLPPAPLADVRWEPPVRGSTWVRRQVAENMPEPLSPLFEDLYVKQGLESAVDRVWPILNWPGNPTDLYGRPMYATVNGYAYSRAALRTSWAATRTILQIFATGYVPIFRRGISMWTDDFLPPYLATVERWKAVDPRAASDAQLLDGIRELAYDEALYLYGTTIALALAKVSDVVLNRFLATVVRRTGVTSALFLRGYPTKALEAEAELQAIAEQIRASAELRALVERTPAERLPATLAASPAGRPVVERLGRFLDRYGHLVYNLDFVEPTQAEAPTPVLMSL